MVMTRDCAVRWESAADNARLTPRAPQYSVIATPPSERGALMAPDVMTIRLHLRRIRVLAVVVDLIERLIVEVTDTRRVVRCRNVI